ncbi:MAG: caspase family protein [Rhodobacteraceae bacterium]|nr:caspase family protein [Paracoccaceae bacterium]
MATALQAEERVALVIGNSVYGTVSSLENPVHDARLLGRALEEQGFKVTLLIDSDQVAMKRGIAQFGRDLREAGSTATGLFYYAGHGVQSYGSNYLLPVDVALSDAADLGLVAVEAQSVLRQMFSARNKTNIVILDACRNNPFTDIPEFNDSGLAEMQAPTGTFLAYATAPGGVALDGLDGNSPFTQAVVAEMSKPGLPIEQMFKQVRISVLEKTSGQQTPWDSSSLTGDFTFAQATVLSGADLEAQQLWNSVQASRDPVQIMLFLRGYPDSPLVKEARSLLAEVVDQELAGEEPVQPVAVQAGPSKTEQQMFEATQVDPGIGSYQAYLQSFPDGVFAEFVTSELAALEKKTNLDPDGEGVPPKVETAETPVTSQPVEPASTVSFTQALLSEVPEVAGRSIADLINTSPIYPPIQGLPEAYWKDQQCSNCHQWTQETICAQANTYLSLNAERSLNKQHPFGGALKLNLKTWASGGCN